MNMAFTAKTSSTLLLLHSCKAALCFLNDITDYQLCSQCPGFRVILYSVSTSQDYNKK